MQLVFQILIRVAEIMTIVAGVAGVTVSLLLLFSPEVVRKVSRTLNKAMLPENRLAALNASLRSELFVLEHHVICGSVLVAASIFILLFLFIGARVPVGFGMFTDMAMAFAILLGKTAGIVGFVAGALLFFSPGVFRALGKKVDIWIDTAPVFDKFDTLSVDVDSVFIRHSNICGLVGLVVSIALIIISTVNFWGVSANLGGRLW